MSLKYHTLLSYLNSLLILSSRRVIGHSLGSRSSPQEPFSVLDRSSRGRDPGDLVDAMVETRIILEKVRMLETRMRYQIEKLVRVAQEPEKRLDMVDGKRCFSFWRIIALKRPDPLAFRPNPQNLMASDQTPGSEDEASYRNNQDRTGPVIDDGIYHPPRVAPVPYTAKSKSQLRKERPPLPSALFSLTSDPSRPHIESTSGLGSTPLLASGRAAHLKKLNEFEENNFSRIIMKKSDAKRRARDEEDLALGGSLGGAAKGRRRAGGLEDEFGDVLRSVERASYGGPGGGKGDGYDELRNRGKRGDLLERSRRDGPRKRDNPFGQVDDSQPSGRAKRSRFELETKVSKKKIRKST